MVNSTRKRQTAATVYRYSCCRIKYDRHMKMIATENAYGLYFICSRADRSENAYVYNTHDRVVVVG